jgi:hypothetical protein
VSGGGRPFLDDQWLAKLAYYCGSHFVCPSKQVVFVTASLRPAALQAGEPFLIFTGAFSPLASCQDGYREEVAEPAGEALRARAGRQRFAGELPKGERAQSALLSHGSRSKELLPTSFWSSALTFRARRSALTTTGSHRTTGGCCP